MEIFIGVFLTPWYNKPELVSKIHLLEGFHFLWNLWSTKNYIYIIYMYLFFEMLAKRVLWMVQNGHSQNGQSLTVPINDFQMLALWECGYAAVFLPRQAWYPHPSTARCPLCPPVFWDSCENVPCTNRCMTFSLCELFFMCFLQIFVGNR